MLLVTGGAGFIGSNFILDWFKQSDEGIINLDILSYAANPSNLATLDKQSDYQLVHGDIGDTNLVQSLLIKYKPRAIVHFAAESHVDRSILDPELFVRTNVIGTMRLLEVALSYWKALPLAEQQNFKFIHVSTDEVYGSLNRNDPPFAETHQYQPNSPYSASKAASDHLVRAYHHTYGLPVITSNCSNNYGPYQFPEKLIPLMILQALKGGALPVYGDGQQIRDWLYVSDHCSALRCLLAQGQLGEVYNIGGLNEQANIDVVHTICDILDDLKPRAQGSYREQIKFVTDRPGHDRRYAINATKIASSLGWKPSETFDTGLKKTVQWYLASEPWVKAIADGSYKEWMTKNYQNNQRL